MKRDNPQTLAPVNLSEYEGIRYLHLGSEWVQGAVRIDAPFDINLEYVQRMMAWLLFVPPESVVERHAMQLGLGAGALTRFCHRRLQMRCTAIEIHPDVVDVCRAWLELPLDDDRLQVVIADAAEEIRREPWLGSVDALAVDLYDHDAAAPVLDSLEFYADCRRLLTPDGCMTVNLFGRSSNFDHSLARICEAFGSRAVWVFKPTREGNTVVLAQRTPTRPRPGVMRDQAEAVEALCGLPARKWLRLLKSVKK